MIRPATHDDLPALLAIADAMHAESSFAGVTFSAEKTAALFAALINGAGFLMVAEADGEVIGGMAGWCAEHFFSHDKTAGDFGLFVHQDRRGGMAAARLLKAFAQWAREQGATMIRAGITTGVHLEASTRLYRAVGFRPVGTVLEFTE